MHVGDEDQQSCETLVGREAEFLRRLDRVDRVAAGVRQPDICASEDCACNRNDEKSDAFNGWRTEPRTWPPSALTTCAVSFSSDGRRRSRP